MMKCYVLFFVLVFHIFVICTCALGTRRHAMRTLGEPAGLPKDLKLTEDEYFTQKLDHFDPLNNNTWQQRYQMNSTFAHRINSPIFLMVGGEAPINAKWMAGGAWQNYANKYGALCIQLEHRYYGKSQPFADLSTENLRFLSSEQALADIAYFIENINKKFKFTSGNKWILFGGSYPGSLVAWARSKYAHLVHGAISSSGPLEAVADFKKYYRVVQDAITTVNKQCALDIHSAALQVEKYLKEPEGGEIINRNFNLCEPLDINNEKDVSSFAEALAGNIAEIVQYNKDNRVTSDVIPLTIDDVCATMKRNDLKSPLEGYSAVNDMILKRNKIPCLDFSYKSTIKELKNLSLDNAARSWTYQTCTEFGFFQTSSSRDDLFGSLYKVDFFIDLCKDAFGENFNILRLNDGIDRTNILYGGKDIDVYRVMFIHGSFDPWHPLGITKTVFGSMPAIYINGTAHCANMYPPSPKDPEQLRAARRQIGYTIGKWLMRNE